MGLSAVYAFVGLAIWTHAALDFLDEPEGQAALFVASVFADGAFETFLGALAILFSDLSVCCHIRGLFQECS